MKVISAIEPATTGTLIAIPSKSPLRSVIASVVEIAAPVDAGIMFCAAARPFLKSLLPGESTIDCVAVYAWTVLRSAFSIPIVSCRI